MQKQIKLFLLTFALISLLKGQCYEGMCRLRPWVERYRYCKGWTGEVCTVGWSDLDLLVILEKRHIIRSSI